MKRKKARAKWRKQDASTGWIPQRKRSAKVKLSVRKAVFNALTDLDVKDHKRRDARDDILKAVEKAYGSKDRT